MSLSIKNLLMFSWNAEAFGAIAAGYRLSSAKMVSSVDICTCLSA